METINETVPIEEKEAPAKIVKMRVKQEEGIFKYHSEDDDFGLPLAFQQRRHDQPIETLLSNLVTKNWRLKERVR